MKNDWYGKTESVWYEYFTLDFAIHNLTSRRESEKLALKQDKKKMLDDVYNRLAKSEQELLKLLYDTTYGMDFGDMSYVDYILKVMCMSRTTFYRKKQIVLKKSALYLGYI
jgi:hypothetical protein